MDDAPQELPPHEIPVPSLTDREIAEQTLELLRSFAMVLSTIGSNPMAAALMGQNGVKF